MVPALRPPASPAVIPAPPGVVPLRLPARAAALIVAAALLAPVPAVAALLGEPTPQASYRTFRHGVDVDRTVRHVTSSRWNSPVTLRNTRINARESYGLMRWRNVLVDASVLFGISKASIDFGTVDMGTSLFWETYAPGTTAPGETRRALTFGDTFGYSWGGSLRARLFEFKGHEVAAGAQVLYSQSTDTGLPAMRLRYNEWDTFVGTTWEQRYVSLYGGLDGSWLIGELRLPDRATDLDQKSILGVYGGLKMHFYRHLEFVTELRLVNQSSYGVQLNYLF